MEHMNQGCPSGMKSTVFFARSAKGGLRSGCQDCASSTVIGQPTSMGNRQPLLAGRCACEAQAYRSPASVACAAVRAALTRTPSPPSPRPPQVLCLDGWPMPMYITMDTSGVFSCLFFIVLVLVSNAVINNFVLAVIVHQYNRRCCEALAEKRQAGATVGMCAAEAAAGGLMKDELSHTDSDLTTTAGDTSPRFDLEQQPKAFGPDMGVRSACRSPPSQRGGLGGACPTAPPPTP